MQRFGHWVKTAELERLDLSCNSLGTDGLRALGLAAPALCQLELESIGLGPGCGKVVTSVIDECSIEKLCVSSNNISSSEAVSMMDAIGRNTHLRQLFLGNNSFGDKGSIVLAKALQVHGCRLTTFHFYRNSVGNEGACAFAELVRDPSCCLREFDLSSNSIGDKGAQAMAAALQDHNTTLRDVRFRGNPVVNGSLSRSIRFFSKANRAGRYLLRSNLECANAENDNSNENGIVDVPIGLWAHVLARAGFQLDVRYYFLQQNPGLFIGNTQNPIESSEIQGNVR